MQFYSVALGVGTFEGDTVQLMTLSKQKKHRVGSLACLDDGRCDSGKGW